MFPLKVARLSFKDMLAAGRFDEVSSEIKPKNFQLPNVIVENLEAEFLDFGPPVYLQEVRSVFRKQNLWHATLPELCAFGAQNPEQQKSRAIAALGSLRRERSSPDFIYKGMSYAPYLYGNARKRGIDIFWVESKWEGSWTFLGICGQSRIEDRQFQIKVDSGKSLFERIKDAKIDLVETRIHENIFPGTPSSGSSVGVELMYFEKVVSHGQLLIEIDRHGYRPITIDEAVALLITHRDALINTTVVAIGSPFDKRHNRYAPAVFSRNGMTHLIGTPVGEKWLLGYRFGVVEK